jgi:peptidoglycan-associated lipoprotein
MTRLLTISAMTLAAGLAGCASMQPHGLVTTAKGCQDQTVQVYFDADSAAVTKEGRAVLHQAADLAKGCRVDKVTILGLADAVGAPDANLALSKKRAEAVSQVLMHDKLPAAELDLQAAGQAGAVNAAGDSRPLRRRADVVLKLSAK